MFKKDDQIDGKYRVDGVCSQTGGMGAVLFVTSLKESYDFQLVLKYCKDTSDEYLRRFKREVRLLSTFTGNSKIIQVIDSNLDNDPPYFVMKYYKDGDLSKRMDLLQISHVEQERIFLQMIDCVQELHSQNEFHRDIKPQNFLMDGDQIVVSDLGLTTEIGSETGFTKSSAYWGTHGYIPPEFLSGGGFKHADAMGDIFMLGKTMYVLLTGRDPQYLIEDDIPPPIFHIIERCCSIYKGYRYQALSDLKQSLVAAYDVLMGRGGGVGNIKQLLIEIKDRLNRENKYKKDEIKDFVEKLALLDEDDKIKIIFEIPDEFFSVIKQSLVIHSLPDFLSCYQKMVESRSYSWSYAETIADNMSVLFNGSDVQDTQKVKALELAVLAAYYMNRFAAMDTCRSMITSVQDGELGLKVVSLLLKYPNTFAAEIEPSACKNAHIANALQGLQKHA